MSNDPTSATLAALRAAKGNVREVPLKYIVLPPDAQVREKLHVELVARYSEVLGELPPIVLFDTGQGPEWLELADGRHRLEAARLLGRSSILAEIRQGTHEDVLDCADTANVKHGQRLSTAEQHKAVRRLYARHYHGGHGPHAKWDAGWDVERIAREMSYSPKTVQNILHPTTLPVKSPKKGPETLTAAPPVSTAPEPTRSRTSPTQGAQAPAPPEPEPASDRVALGATPTMVGGRPPYIDGADRGAVAAEPAASSTSSEHEGQALGEKPPRPPGGPQVTVDRTAFPERPEPTGKERWPYDASEATPRQRELALAEARRVLEQMKQLYDRLIGCEEYFMTDFTVDDAQWLATMGANMLWWADTIFYIHGRTVQKWGTVRATLGVPEPQAKTKKRP